MSTYSILLGCGLRLECTTSFLRQLILLSKFLEKRNVRTAIFGPDGVYTGRHPPDGKQRSSENSGFFEKLGKTSDTRAAILLGYPDQFSFLHRAPENLQLYLWAQFSRPPAKGALREVCSVPLTQKTKTFILLSGEKRVTHVIPHGVDTRVYRPLDRETVSFVKKTMGLEDRFVIGSVGAHTPRKRFDLIIKTFAEIQRVRTEAALIIKTDRIKSLEGTDLQAYAQSEGVFDKTIFITEKLTAGRMCALYNVMDIFLNLSEWEGFCIPAIEAMSCGIPVSSMPVQGPGETVPYEELRIPPRGIVEENGSVLLECEPKEAAEIIVDVSCNRNLVRELSRTGRKEATSKFDIRTVALLWDRLIGGHAN